MLKLCNYSSSSDSEEDTAQPPATKQPAKKYMFLYKRFNCYKFSFNFRNLPSVRYIFECHEEEKEDSQQHGGRTRTFGHERGIWASFVYISVSFNESIQNLQIEMISFLNAHNTALQIFAIDELHLSLTRTFVLRHHWIKLFSQSLSKCLPVGKQK